jgi:hypothetical protein
VGAVTFSLDPRLMECLAAALPFQVFFETGTFEGDGVAIAAPHVGRVITVESSQPLWQAAAQRFQGDPRIQVLQGNSPEVIARVRPSLGDEATLYWLDAHWCVAQNTAGDKSQCPLLEEIAAIGRLGATSMVLIDDARLFLAPPAEPHDVAQWPELNQIVQALRRLSDSHEIMVVNDVIAFYPPGAHDAMQAYARRHGMDWLRAVQSLRENDELRATMQDLNRQLKEKEAAIAEKEAAIDEKEAEVLDAHVALERAERERGFLQKIVDEGSHVKAGAGGEEAGDIRERLLKDLEGKEKVILELRRANTAYRAAFAMFGFLIRPVNALIGWTVSGFAGMAPRLGVLNQHAPKPLEPPAPYWLRTPANATPRIAIVTPSYQQGRFIERTIRSVLEQGYPNLAYHVQDGGSTDGTREILERYADKLSWESAKDTGQTQAINRGFAHVSGDIMAWLNSDDILLPGALAYVADYFASHPEVDVIYGHRLLLDTEDRQIGRWMVPRHNDYVLSWADYVPQETLFWRRRLWDKVGARVDESFRFAMDWDLLVRFRDADARFVRVPRFLGGFRIHPEQKTSAAINEIGFAEMTRIRERALGRVPTQREIGKAVLPYLIRHIMVDMQWRVRSALGART